MSALRATLSVLESADAEGGEGGKVIDLMAVLRRSLSKKAVVSNAGSEESIVLAAHRARRAKPTEKKSPCGRISTNAAGRK